MARPEKEPKTPLGRRLREVRRHFGVDNREPFAKTLNISKDSLALYERGEAVPTATVLAAYREQYRVNINWLVLGEGEMFEDPTLVPWKEELEPSLMKKLAGIVIRVHRDAGIRLHSEEVTSETTKFYNDLARRVDDLNDREEIEVVLPQVELRLRKRLAEAVAEPGSGKRSA